MQGDTIGGPRVGPPLLLRVLDGFVLEATDHVHISIKNRKASGLLAYLALSPTGRETRERLAGLLWSDRSEEQARASLRQCLKQLRDALAPLGGSAFHAERQDVFLTPGLIDVDIRHTLAGLTQVQATPDLPSGGIDPERILYGFETLDQAYAAWLHVVREQWRNSLVDALQDALRDQSRPAAARRRAAEALIQIDRTHEEAHRFLIERLAQSGNIPAALRQYNELWTLLGDDYDMEPSDETQRLIAEIKSGAFEQSLATRPQTQRRTAPHPPAPSRLPVLEVYPFQPGGPDRRENYLTEGFRRDLIAGLVRFREWIIVEGQPHQPDALPADGIRAPMTQYADYLLEGTFFSDASDLHLVLTVRDTATARYIWSERYRLRLTDWFAAQQSAVRRISAALNIYLSAERLSQQIGEPRLSPEAYDQWLRGNDLIRHWDPEAELEAETIFRRIIESTPSFAPAYSSLASIFNSRHLVFPGLRRAVQLEEEALRFAQHSVNIDPLDTRGQLALAWSSLMRGRYDQAQLHYGFAHELNPNNPTSLISCAHGLSFCGDHERARAMADQTLELAPVMPAFHWGYMICVRFFDKDYAGAVMAAEQANDVIPDLPGWKAAALAHLGEHRHARSAADRFIGLVSEKWRGDMPCTPDAIVDWFLDAFPIRRREDFENLREGLRKAGLPVDLDVAVRAV